MFIFICILLFVRIWMWFLCIFFVICVMILWLFLSLIWNVVLGRSFFMMLGNLSSFFLVMFFFVRVICYGWVFVICVWKFGFLRGICIGMNRWVCKGGDFVVFVVFVLLECGGKLVVFRWYFDVVVVVSGCYCERYWGDVCCLWEG